MWVLSYRANLSNFRTLVHPQHVLRLQPHEPNSQKRRCTDEMQVVPLAHSHVTASCANGIPGLWYHISRLMAFLTAAERTNHLGSGLDRHMHCTMPGPIVTEMRSWRRLRKDTQDAFSAPWSKNQLHFLQRYGCCGNSRRFVNQDTLTQACGNSRPHARRGFVNTSGV